MCIVTVIKTLYATIVWLLSSFPGYVPLYLSVRLLLEDTLYSLQCTNNPPRSHLRQLLVLGLQSIFFITLAMKQTVVCTYIEKDILYFSL